MKEEKKLISLNNYILELEKKLLLSEIRKSSKDIKKLLDSDFIEFCSSGKTYVYKEGDTFQDVNDNTILNWEIVDFKVKELTDDCVLSLYKLIKHENNQTQKYSLRSSIWKKYNDTWKMVFHQGTLTNNA